MAHSVEGRVPLLDHHVGEFLFNTPADLKIRGITEKYVLREATRDVLTDTAYRRQKYPFLSPPNPSGARNKMSTLIQDTLRSKPTESVPFFNAKAIRNLADELNGMTPAERGAIDSDLMMVMSTIFMHERFGVSSA